METKRLTNKASRNAWFIKIRLMLRYIGIAILPHAFMIIIYLFYSIQQMIEYDDSFTLFNEFMNILPSIVTILCAIFIILWFKMIMTFQNLLIKFLVFMNIFILFWYVYNAYNIVNTDSKTIMDHILASTIYTCKDYYIFYLGLHIACLLYMLLSDQLKAKLHSIIDIDTSGRQTLPYSEKVISDKVEVHHSFKNKHIIQNNQTSDDEWSV